jgi:Family of unknown function (DUF6527)
MSRVVDLEHEFVEVLPDEMEEGVLYISMEFGAVAHLCCCGCGNQVYTPLKPNRWRLTFDGENIWLCPSIGNWNFDCKSHYWVLGSRVRWAAQMSKAEVEAIREQSREGWVPPPTSAAAEHDRDDGRTEPTGPTKRTLWARIKHFFSR